MNNLNNNTINHGLRANAALTAKALVATPWFLLNSVINGSASGLRNIEYGRKLETSTWQEIAKVEGEVGDYVNHVIVDIVDSIVANATYTSNSLSTDEQVSCDAIAKARALGDTSLEKSLSKKLRMAIHREKRAAVAAGKKLNKAATQSTVDKAIDEVIASWKATQTNP